MMRGRPFAWTLARLVFSLALVGLVASRIDPAAFGAALAGADLRWLALALLAALASWLPASWKWQRLLMAFGNAVPVRTLYALNLAGMFYSLFLPGQIAGEVVKGIKLARRGVPGAQTAISIGVDRLTGLMALGMLALGGMAVSPPIEGTPVLAMAAAGILLLSVSPLLALALVSRLPLRWERAVAHLPAHRLLVSALNLLLSLGRSFAEYRRTPGTLVLAFGLALVYQLVIVVSNVCAALAFGIHLPLSVMTWVVAMVSVLHMVPLALAGLGVREGAYVVLLSRYGIPEEHGLALALAVFGIIIAQGLTGGLLEVVNGLRHPRPATGEADAATPAVPSLRK